MNPEIDMTGTMAVPEKDRLDKVSLTRWLTENIEGFKGPITLTKFKGGQSNPTYRLDTADRAYVLRRKPFGQLLPSAHAVDREYRAIKALNRAGFPVAKAYALCEDDKIIGAQFYIMAMVEGRILWDGALPGQGARERGAIYHNMIDTLAMLHRFDPDKIGLGQHGKSGNYCERQITRWTKQYRLSELETNAHMDKLIQWLESSIPEQKYHSIAHGDYRLDNIIFDTHSPKILAVLDWELSTLGDPIADFAYWLMSYEMKQDGRSGLAGADLKSLGIPTRDEAITRYLEKSGIEELPPIEWYLAYNLFRIAAILQGIKKRVVDGTANSPAAALMAERVPALAQAGWEAARRAGAS